MPTCNGCLTNKRGKVNKFWILFLFVYTFMIYRYKAMLKAQLNGYTGLIFNE